MDDIYENIEEYTLNSKGKKLIVFYEIVADMFSNKTQSSSNYSEYMQKIKHSLVFITQSRFLYQKILD